MVITANLSSRKIIFYSRVTEIRNCTMARCHISICKFILLLQSYSPLSVTSCRRLAKTVKNNQCWYCWIRSKWLKGKKNHMKSQLFNDEMQYWRINWSIASGCWSHELRCLQSPNTVDYTCQKGGKTVWLNDLVLTTSCCGFYITAFCVTLQVITFCTSWVIRSGLLMMTLIFCNFVLQKTKPFSFLACLSFPRLSYAESGRQAVSTICILDIYN